MEGEGYTLIILVSGFIGMLISPTRGLLNQIVWRGKTDTLIILVSGFIGILLSLNYPINQKYTMYYATIILHHVLES